MPISTNVSLILEYIILFVAKIIQTSGNTKKIKHKSWLEYNTVHKLYTIFAFSANDKMPKSKIVSKKPFVVAEYTK